MKPRLPVGRATVTLSMLFAAAMLTGCPAGEPTAEAPPEASVENATEKPEPVSVLFEPATASGLDFTYRSGMSGELYFPEIMGGGGAWIDFDNDGDLDIYLVQGGHLGSETAEPMHDRLFRNDLGAEGPRFTDVTAEAGLTSMTGYGMGVAVGDVDNDGWTDLYITNFGSNHLLRNNGADGSGVVTFTDITAETGTDDDRWSTSAAFVDVDHDGRLDLYVANYVDFRLSNHKRCVNEAGVADFCGPRSYQPVTDRLWRNLGPDSTGKIRFADMSADIGLLDVEGPGLGVVAADFNDDGRIDLFVANDQARNHLWLNEGDFRLREAGLESGSAMDSQGRVQASMGVDAGDVDGDGDLDLFMTHLLQEVNTLYLNDGNAFFTDRTTSSGLGSPSISVTGFGTSLFDADNDGDLDVVSVNGEVRMVPEQQAAGDPFPLRQPDHLFLNQGAGDFVDAHERVPVFAEPRVSRGAIVGDVDNDGDTDLLVTYIEDPARLLLNRQGQEQTWIGFRLLGNGRDMLGAEVTLEGAGTPLRRRAHTDSGYLTARDPRVLFGLGSHDGSRTLREGPLAERTAVKPGTARIRAATTP